MNSIPLAHSCVQPISINLLYVPGTVSTSCSYTRSLKTEADTGDNAGEENLLFLYARFALIAPREKVSFPPTDPVHPSCRPSVYCYSNIYKYISYSYTHIHTSYSTAETDWVGFSTTVSHTPPMKVMGLRYTDFQWLGLAISPQSPEGNTVIAGQRVQRGAGTLWRWGGEGKGGCWLSVRWCPGVAPSATRIHRQPGTS